MHPSPLLERPDAVAGAPQDVDATVPAHYGSPLPEQAALVEGLALSALARDVVAVTGPDRLSWLTTLSSQVLTHLAPGDGGVETLLMDAQGHITHALAALDDGQVLWLVTEAGAGPALADFLDSMRFRLRVEATDRPDVQVLGAMGQGLEALEEAARSVNLPDPHAGTALVGTWRDPWPGVVEGGTSYDLGRTRPHPGQDYRAGMVLVPRDAVTQVAEAFLGEEAPDGRRRLAGALAWEALRVEAGRPRAAREVDARTIAHELDWLRTAVHLSKGCYPGQETIARTLNLGRPPRRLTILQLDGLGGRAPVPGAVVRLGERAVGTVTSVVRHHECGPMALALLRRGVPSDAALSVDLEEHEAGGDRGPARVDATQEILVAPEGRAQASPAQRPGAELRRR